MKTINLGVLAHVDAGKTTLTEQMLYQSGEIRSVGRVDHGTAHTDFLDIERQRGISVRAAVTTFRWKDAWINLIDTPGHTDFAGEVERSLTAVDAAILVVSSAEGVQPHTKRIWKALSALRIPTVFFMNKLDRVGSNAERTYREILNLAPTAFPLQTIQGEGTPEITIIPLTDSPSWVELAAEQDDALLSLYMENIPLPPARVRKCLLDLVSDARAFPVCMGSAMLGRGVDALMDALTCWLPTARIEEGDLSGVVFKIEHDPAVGKVAHTRLYSGTLHCRDTVDIPSRNLQQKVTQIRKYHGKRHESLTQIMAGDIAGLCGLTGVRTGDILGRACPLHRHASLAVPLLRTRLFTASEEELPRLIEALGELSDEDPLLDFRWIRETREVVIHITGPIQMEVLRDILKDRYFLAVTHEKPRVIYKETPLHEGVGHESYTMPKPCWAVLEFVIQPGPRGSGLSYHSVVQSNDILYRYQAHVEEMVPRALKQGIKGWEVTDLSVTLTNGGYHHVHTHPLDFYVATPMALMNGLMNTGTRLLEPMLLFAATVPEEMAGKLIGELVNMRAVFESPVVTHGDLTMQGILPAATSLDFPIRLASITGGRGQWSTEYSHYQDCPEGMGEETPYLGIHPLDRSKYILWARGALGEFGL